MCRNNQKLAGGRKFMKMGWCGRHPLSSPTKKGSLKCRQFKTRTSDHEFIYSILSDFKIENGPI